MRPSPGCFSSSSAFLRPLQDEGGGTFISFMFHWHRQALLNDGTKKCEGLGRNPLRVNKEATEESRRIRVEYFLSARASLAGLTSLCSFSGAARGMPPFVVVGRLQKKNMGKVHLTTWRQERRGSSRTTSASAYRGKTQMMTHNLRRLPGKSLSHLTLPLRRQTCVRWRAAQGPSGNSSAVVLHPCETLPFVGSSESPSSSVIDFQT